MCGHGAAKMSHAYTPVWRSTATFICGGYAIRQITYKYIQYLYEYRFRVPVLVEAGQD